MERRLTHLPKTKNAELEKITNTIREMRNDIEMIILFGSYARGDWRSAGSSEDDGRNVQREDRELWGKRQIKMHPAPNFKFMMPVLNSQHNFYDPGRLINNLYAIAGTKSIAELGVIF